jgi:hypothetical protein
MVWHFTAASIFGSHVFSQSVDCVAPRPATTSVVTRTFSSRDMMGAGKRGDIVNRRVIGWGKFQLDEVLEETRELGAGLDKYHTTEVLGRSRRIGERALTVSATHLTPLHTDDFNILKDCGDLAPITKPEVGAGVVSCIAFCTDLGAAERHETSKR